jgi:hypothetical protein
VVIAIAAVVWEFTSSWIARYLDSHDTNGESVARSARIRTLLPLLRNVFLVFLIGVVGLTVMAELGVNIAPLLAGAGIIGLAIGFGSQALVRDIITGLFILIEDTISVGEVVTVGPHTGVVEAMSIRAVRLRDLSGSVHTVPWGDVTSVINLTKGFSYYTMDIGVAYREDVDMVMRDDPGDRRRPPVGPEVRRQHAGAHRRHGARFLRRQRRRHQGPAQDRSAAAVGDGPRVQPPHEAPLRRARHRDPVPAPHDLFRRGQVRQGPRGRPAWAGGPAPCRRVG